MKKVFSFIAVLLITVASFAQTNEKYVELKTKIKSDEVNPVGLNRIIYQLVFKNMDEESMKALQEKLLAFEEIDTFTYTKAGDDFDVKISFFGELKNEGIRQAFKDAGILYVVNKRGEKISVDEVQIKS
tara:strand:- start:77075 stop:77461 length:387 start_codon:yes stop_codon:yes gene_type:complete